MAWAIRTEGDRVHSTRNYLPKKMEEAECSETLAYIIQMPGNHPKESIQLEISYFQ